MFTEKWKIFLDKLAHRKEEGPEEVKARLARLKTDGIAKTIVRKRHFFEMIFIVLIFLSAINAPLVKVNYDLTE